MATVERGTYDPARDKVLEDNPLDQLSRERCSIAAAVVMVRTLSPDILHDIVRCGKSEFERIYKPTAKLHAFKQEDVDRIWSLIVRTAELNPPGSVHVERMPQL